MTFSNISRCEFEKAIENYPPLVENYSIGSYSKLLVPCLNF